MALDSMLLAGLVRELDGEVSGGKIEKVFQPARSEIVLSLRCRDGRRDLFIGGASGSARVHITAADYEKPQEPPMFCMLLRKHLVGARIERITQPENERVVMMELDAPGMFGEGEKRGLVVELFGRVANIILTDGDGLITDCLYRTGGADEKRAVLPGMLYRLPPAQEKLSLFGLTREDIAAKIAAARADDLFDKWLIRTFAGLSPLTAREISSRACGDTSAPMYRVDAEKAADEVYKVAALCTKGGQRPYLVTDGEGSGFDFSYLPITQYGGAYTVTEMDSFSALLDTFWASKSEAERRRARSASLVKTVKQLRDRTARRVAAQREELADTENREYLRECGDIITSNLHAMRKGMTVLRAFDYYAPEGGEREIRLDPLKTPQQNAAKYYKDYTRAKNAVTHLTEQIARGEEELDYLESVLEELERAGSTAEIQTIRAELIGAGILREQNAKRKEKVRADGYMRFTSSAGLAIRVGRNNLENDSLTLKNSAKTDLWLHAQKIHGSHVVLSCAGAQPDEKSVSEAASLAAYYSKGRESGKVPVDYTLIKYVKKPNGAKPGMVIYTDYRTILVEPKSKID